MTKLDYLIAINKNKKEAITEIISCVAFTFVFALLLVGWVLLA
jgi:hypothetical protein